DYPLDVASNRLLDVLSLHVVSVERAYDLEVAVILSRGACDSHEHVEEIRVIEDVAYEGDRAAIGGGALRRMRDHGSSSLLALDVVLARQLVERLDDRDAADTIVLRQLPLGREKGARGELAAL